MKKTITSILISLAALVAFALPASASPQPLNTPWTWTTADSHCVFTMQYGNVGTVAYATAQLTSHTTGTNCAVFTTEVADTVATPWNSWPVPPNSWNDTTWRSTDETNGASTAYASAFCLKESGVTGYMHVVASILADTTYTQITNIANCT